MGDKIPGITLPSDIGEDFEQEREILTDRPRLEYEGRELDRDPSYIDLPAGDPEDTEIEEARQKTKAIIAGYKALDKLTDLTQRKIDKVVGNYNVNLDSTVDASAVAALKRTFPNKKDFSSISYKEYKQALGKIAAASPAPALVTDKAVKEARNEPSRVKMGGYGSKAGSARPSLDKTAQAIKPVDQDEFQKNAILELFKLMFPMISGAIDKADKKKE
jgi:hypothetical protein